MLRKLNGDRCSQPLLRKLNGEGFPPVFIVDLRPTMEAKVIGRLSLLAEVDSQPT